MFSPTSGSLPHVKKGFNYRRIILPYALLLPAFSIYAFTILFNLLNTFILSFYGWDGISPTKQFIGLRNYLELFTDHIFKAALLHNLIWTALTIVIPLFVGLILATILGGRIKNCLRLFFAAVYFIPGVIAFVVSAVIWGWVYNPQFGLLNFILKRIGWEHLCRPWLADPQWALLSVNMIGNWTYFGFCVLIFLTYLQNIDRTLYEAAKIDGAGSFQRFVYITIPALKGALTFLIIYSVIGAMKFFDIVYIATRGGPFHKTEILSTYIFTLFFFHTRASYGATVGVVLTTIILVLSLAIFALRKEENL